MKINRRQEIVAWRDVALADAVSGARTKAWPGAAQRRASMTVQRPEWDAAYGMSMAL